VDPEPGARFRPLDGMRGLAIIMVLAVHSFIYTGTSPLGRAIDTAARAGWVGITLFFVLSGFLITGILLDSSERPHYLRDFYARRALRIFPLYFAFLAVYLFVVPFIPYASDRLAQPATSVYYWTYLANMQEWLSGVPTVRNPLGPLWSLAVEEQIYFLWPFLIVLFRRGLPALWLTLAVASFAFRAWTRLTAQSIEASYAWAPANVEAFAAGALVAWLLRHHHARLESWAPSAAVISGLGVATLWIVLGHFNFWSAPVQILTVGTSAAVLFFAASIGVAVTTSESSLFNRLLRLSSLRVFGKYSYAIYLFHSPIMELLWPVQRAGAVVFAMSVTACSLAAAFVSWHVWEKPFLNLKRHFPSSARPLTSLRNAMSSTEHDTTATDARRVA
jgi:peptidoglycan/LPS O-acetylase OafA/YrhL